MVFNSGLVYLKVVLRKKKINVGKLLIVFDKLSNLDFFML